MNSPLMLHLMRLARRFASWRLSDAAAPVLLPANLRPRNRLRKSSKVGPPNGKSDLVDDSIEDVRQVVSYIADDNPTATLRVGQRILNFSRLFESSPRMGHVYLNEGGEVRVSVVDDYKIYYSYDDTRDCVTVHHVWHGARQPPAFR